MADDLLLRARQVARREKAVLQSLAEEGLRSVLERRETELPRAIEPHVVTGEGLDHHDRLRSITESEGVTGTLFHDARVAAICLSHGVKVLWTADRDFSRFPALRTLHPLVG